MANIAAIFHWSHKEIAAMTLPDLLIWNNHAISWWNDAHKAKK